MVTRRDFVKSCAVGSGAAVVGLRPRSAVAQAPKKAVASPALQKEFDGFIGKFRAALKGNDSAAVAGMTRYAELVGLTPR